MRTALPAGSAALSDTSLHPAPRHIIALDGLRGLAILMVLAEHLGGGRQSNYMAVRFIAGSFRFGWAGVSLFFVLSGFLITGILWDSFDHPGWWRRFYMRRSLRIFPLYYLSLLYGFILSLFVAHRALRAFPVYVLYLQDFSWFDKLTGLVPQNWFVLAPFWSLAVEEQFYLLWPLMLYRLRHRRVTAMRVCLVLFFTSLLTRLIFLRMNDNLLWPYHALPCRAGELLIGAWAALAMRGHALERDRLHRYAPWALALSSAAILQLAVSTRGSLETIEPAWLGIGLFLVPIFFASILVLCLRPGWLQRLFENPVLCWYGKISYGVYVFHALLAPLFERLLAGLHLPISRTAYDLLQSFVIFVQATLIALLSYHTLEAYFRRRKHSFKERYPPGPQPATHSQITSAF